MEITRNVKRKNEYVDIKQALTVMNPRLAKKRKKKKGNSDEYNIPNVQKISIVKKLQKENSLANGN